MVIGEKWKIYITRVSRPNWQWVCAYRVPPLDAPVNSAGPVVIPCAAGFWGSQQRCLEDATEHALEKHGVRL